MLSERSMLYERPMFSERPMLSELSTFYEPIFEIAMAIPLNLREAYIS